MPNRQAPDSHTSPGKDLALFFSVLASRCCCNRPLEGLNCSWKAEKALSPLPTLPSQRGQRSVRIYSLTCYWTCGQQTAQASPGSSLEIPYPRLPRQTSWTWISSVAGDLCSHSTLWDQVLGVWEPAPCKRPQCGHQILGHRLWHTDGTPAAQPRTTVPGRGQAAARQALGFKARWSWSCLLVNP